MQLTPLLSTFLASRAALAQPLEPRSTCELTGFWVLRIVVGSGGPGQTPISSTGTNFYVSQNGGGEKSIDGNSISGKPVTLHAKDTGFGADVTYTAKFDVGHYKGCNVQFKGKSYDGKGEDGGVHDTGASSAKCVVSFPC